MRKTWWNKMYQLDKAAKKNAPFWAAGQTIMKVSTLQPFWRKATLLLSLPLSAAVCFRSSILQLFLMQFLLQWMWWPEETRSPVRECPIHLPLYLQLEEPWVFPRLPLAQEEELHTDVTALVCYPTASFLLENSRDSHKGGFPFPPLCTSASSYS